MSLIAFSTAHPANDVELQRFERLAVTLSSQFARLQVEGIGTAITAALEQVARLIDVESITLIEFTDGGTIDALHAWPAVSATFPTAGPPEWLLDRLVRDEVVAVSRPEDLPAEVRPGGSASSALSVLGVPVVVAGRVVCALVVGSSRSARRWAAPAIERLRLVTEIVGLALQRVRQDAALRASLATIERLNARLAADNAYLQEEIKAHHDFDDIIGESEPLRRALTRLGQVAPMNASVLLVGETGTGKELFARALHDRSRRRTRALICVNCAALPPTLVESELFGHEKGAFTGAVSMRQGRFELADGGTIFLDEIGDLTPEVQAKLLRVLQEGEFERVGSSRTRRVDVRVIAATHRDLEADVADGRFRADLYYRLNVFPIVLPALRERREDVPHLVWFFIHRHQRRFGRCIAKVPESVMHALQQHAWPGNVRELGNVVERALIQSTGDTLQLDDGFGRVRRSLSAGSAPSADRLDSIQRAHIESVLADCGWRINGTNNAAERLGLHPNTLRFRMKKLGIVLRPDRQHRQRRVVGG
jgi:transcriptional regulator with GAF, ATPase, and Fis domain